MPSAGCWTGKRAGARPESRKSRVDRVEAEKEQARHRSSTLYFLSSTLYSAKPNRGDRIRTCDFQLPKLAL